MSLDLDSTRSEGTETRAEVVFLMVLDLRCHSIPEAREGNDLGRVER